MMRRIAALAAVAAASFLVLAGFAAARLGTAQAEAKRISFVLATGSTGGTYFPVGQAIAELVSHPPGVARCDAPDACGPTGLVATARTSEGSIANILDVNAGRADGGLAQADVVAEAIAGKDDFRRYGRQTHIRAIADLFPEQMHIVAAAKARISTVADLEGKRVTLGASGSGTARTARAILAAYRIPARRLKASFDPPDVAAARLDQGKIDAFFFVGGAPVDLVRNLVGSGKAVLISIDGAGRKRLLAAHPELAAETIPARDYAADQKPVETVGTHAIWIVNDAMPDDIVYGMTRALFNPANRDLLETAHASARSIGLDTATKDIPAPLHSGAIRFYNENRVPLGAPKRAARS